MNFKKFKSIDMPDVNVNADTEYLNKLNALPPHAPKKRTLAAVGTVAAAVAIVAIVALWALIGRGLRGTATVPANESIEITAEMQAQFEAMYGKYSLHSFPSFERGTLPSKEAIIEFVDYEPESYKAKSGDYGDMYNAFVLDWFGVTPNYRVDTNARKGRVINVNYSTPKLLSFTRSTLDDGTKIITLTYGETDSWVVTLSYVPVSDFEPDYFIEKTTLNTIFVHKIDKENMRASVYKVPGELATQILDAKRYLKHSDSTCKCIPDYRVYDSNLWYDFMLDGIMPHTTRYDGPSCKLTEDEQSRFNELFEKCITDENFVETKELEYTPTESEVTVTVPEISTEYKAGSYTITGDDAKALITALETKSYTGFNGLQGICTAKVTIGERNYWLNISDDSVHIENKCGGIELSKDDEIVTIVEKYIKAPKSKEVVLTDVTEWYEELTEQQLKDSLNQQEATPSDKSMPKTKELEFNGKKYSVTLKDSWYQQMSWPLYKYTDGNGIGFVFTENNELVEYEYSGSPVNTGTVSKDEAIDIAKDFAKKMFGEQIDDYTFDEVTEIGPSGPTEKYIISFSKKYGKDGYLKGEGYFVEVKTNGDVIRCSMRELYEFKKLDTSIFENISKSDIEKAAIPTTSQHSEFSYTVEGASITFYGGKSVIDVMVLSTDNVGGTMAGLTRIFEVTEK